MKIQCVDTPRNATPRLSVLIDPKILRPLGIDDFNGLFDVLFFLAVADKIAGPKQSKGGDETGQRNLHVQRGRRGGFRVAANAGKDRFAFVV